MMMMMLPSMMSECSGKLWLKKNVLWGITGSARRLQVGWSVVI
jgi:hypothetical protein